MFDSFDSIAKRKVFISIRLRLIHIQGASKQEETEALSRVNPEIVICIILPQLLFFYFCFSSHLLLLVFGLVSVERGEEIKYIKSSLLASLEVSSKKFPFTLFLWVKNKILLNFTVCGRFSESRFEMLTSVVGPYSLIITNTE